MKRSNAALRRAADALAREKEYAAKLEQGGFDELVNLRSSNSRLLKQCEDADRLLTAASARRLLRLSLSHESWVKAGVGGDSGVRTEWRVFWKAVRGHLKSASLDGGPNRTGKFVNSRPVVGGRRAARRKRSKSRVATTTRSSPARSSRSPRDSARQSLSHVFGVPCTLSNLSSFEGERESET